MPNVKIPTGSLLMIRPRGAPLIREDGRKGDEAAGIAG